jgi:hypothetical protein
LQSPGKEEGRTLLSSHAVKKTLNFCGELGHMVYDEEHFLASEGKPLPKKNFAQVPAPEIGHELNKLLLYLSIYLLRIDVGVQPCG